MTCIDMVADFLVKTSWKFTLQKMPNRDIHEVNHTPVVWSVNCTDTALRRVVMPSRRRQILTRLLNRKLIKTMVIRRCRQLVKNSGGFSIAELLTAVAVFGIVGAVAVPQFVSFRPKNRLNGATRQIYSQLMWARSKAVTENGSYVVTFPTNQTMLITGSTTRTVNIQPDYVDVTVSSTASTITFSSRGTSDVAPTITLTNSGGTKTVTLKITGSATIS